MTTALLTTTYFGPVQWYQKLRRYDRVFIEQCDTYRKQTFRNRCIIAAPDGPQALTIPVEHAPNHSLTRDIRISDHGRWRQMHWNALQTAYSESPFFEYYADDIRPFFEQRYDYLVDLNEAIRQTMCQLLDLSPTVGYTQSWAAPSLTADHAADGVTDLRDVISAKHPQPDPDFQPRSYWQVFDGRNGFLPNLSILDLLFNQGPESIFYL